jgi:outer membrane protein TolC
MLRWHAALALSAGLAVSIVSVDAFAQDEKAPASVGVLTPQVTLETAIAENPRFAEAGLAVKEAELDLEAQESLRPWTLNSDGGFRRDEQPTVGIIENGTRISTSYNSNIELLKQFVYGTSLSTRLDFSRVTTEVPFTLPGTGTSQVQVIGPNYGAALTVSVNQPLWRGFGRELGELPFDAAKQQKTVAELQRQRAAHDLAAEVLDAYWTWVRAAFDAQSQRDALGRAESLRDATIAQIEAGQLAELERDIVGQRTAAAEQAVVLAEAAERDAYEGLVVVMGLDPDTAPQWSPPADVPPLTNDLPTVEALVERARSANPDIALLTQDVLVTELQLRRAEDQTDPQLDATASISQAGLGETVGAPLADIATLEFTSLFIGLVLRVPLDNGLAEKQLEADEVAVERSKLRKAEAIRNIDLRVRQARRALETQRRRLELSREEVGLARKNLAAMQDKFDAGLASQLEVIQLEDDLQSAELRYTQARIDSLRAQVTLQRITGQLLEAYGLSLDAQE